MRKVLRRILNKLGYDLVKTAKSHFRNPSKTYQVKVGRYNISMPGNNPLVKHYEYFPDYNIELGKLAELVYKKYPDYTMLDIGANAGDTIAVVKSAIDIPIIAIEGDKFSFSFLKKNSEKFNNIFPINEFLGEQTKELLVNMDKEGWNNTIVPSNEGAKLIKLKTLDDVLALNGLFEKNIKLIKIDAEGFDTIILRGAFSTIAKHCPILYFEYNRENMDIIGEDGTSTLLSLNDYGYERIIFFDNHNRRLLHTFLADKNTIQQLHDYADGIKGLIPHYDICIFNHKDSDIFEEFLRIN